MRDVNALPFDAGKDQTVHPAFSCSDKTEVYLRIEARTKLSQ